MGVLEVFVTCQLVARFVKVIPTDITSSKWALTAEGLIYSFQSLNDYGRKLYFLLYMCFVITLTPLLPVIMNFVSETTAC